MFVREHGVCVSKVFTTANDYRMHSGVQSMGSARQNALWDYLLRILFWCHSERTAGVTCRVTRVTRLL